MELAEFEMKVQMNGCEALKALFRAMFPSSEALLVSSYSKTKEEPGLLEVGDVVCDGRVG